MKSFKDGIKAGEVKRADAMKVRIEDIHEEPGFNLRRENEDLEASIDALADYIAQGGIVPPLEVRPREDGGCWVVDGHRRRRAYLRAETRGATIRDADGNLWVSIVAFTGNDADRVARIITSAESRGLTQLEIAEGYKRLIAFNWTPEKIAQKVGKTRQHVDQLLILANADSSIQDMVDAGNVSATTAIDVVRKHGSKAGGVLADAVDSAKASGKKRATAGAVKGKPLPRRLVDEVEPLLYRIADKATSAGTITLEGDEAAALLEVIADIRETRQKQAAKAQSDAVKSAQTDIEDVVDGQA